MKGELTIQRILEHYKMLIWTAEEKGMYGMIVVDYKNRDVRITDERLEHIYSRHPETKGEIEKIKETLSNPDYVQEGDNDEFISFKLFDKTPISDKKYCAVVFKIDFIITAYFTRRPTFRRKLVWKK